MNGYGKLVPRPSSNPEALNAPAPGPADSPGGGSAAVNMPIVTPAEQQRHES